MLTTSDGRRLADIRSEMDARRIVHTLGITQLRGPYSWDVVDTKGDCSSLKSGIGREVVANDCRAQSEHPRYQAIPCCYGPTTGAASAQSSTQTRLGTRSTGAAEEASCLGIPAARWPSLDSISDADGRDVPEGARARDGTCLKVLEVCK